MRHLVRSTPLSCPLGWSEGERRGGWHRPSGRSLLLSLCIFKELAPDSSRAPTTFQRSRPGRRSALGFWMALWVKSRPPNLVDCSYPLRTLSIGPAPNPALSFARTRACTRPLVCWGPPVSNLTEGQIHPLPKFFINDRRNPAEGVGHSASLPDADSSRARRPVPPSSGHRRQEPAARPKRMRRGGGLGLSTSSS